MELDELKTAWQALDKRLERDSAINLQLLRDRRIEKARSSLRPLYWGQVMQVLIGLLFIAAAALLWSTQPDAVPVIIAGVVVHAYGVACIMMAGIVLAGLSRIDNSAPVLEIQKQLARVRRAYIVSGIVAGLPWWFMWVPILMLLLGLGGVDLYAHAPGMVWSGLVIGVAGLLGTWWFHRWSRRPERARLAQAMDDAATGRSLRKAQAQLDELLRFERE
ncbi:MAG: hypothetical protein ACREUQ_08935 [Burkholderiales bacterium]